MAYGKRKKGGQRLMEIAQAGAKRRAAKKERTAKNFGVGSKNTRSTPSRGRTKVQITMNKPVRKTVAKAPVTKPTVKKPVAKKPAAKKPAKTDAQKLADYRKNPTKGMAPRNLRTEAQRAADRKRLMNQMSEARGMSKLADSMTKDIEKSRKIVDAVDKGSMLIGGPAGLGVKLGGRAVGQVAKSALGKKIKEKVAKAGLTKEGKKLKKVGKYRDVKGRIQNIDPKKDKSKNVFLGGTKKKSKSDAIEVDVYGPRPKSVFNPKGVPATKGAAKSKPTPKAEPKPETKPKVKAKAKTPSKKATKKAASSPKKKRIDRMFGKDNQNPVVKSSVKKKSAPKKKRISRMFGKDNQNPVVKSATKKKAPAKKKAVKKSTNKKATKPVNKPMPKDNKAKQDKRKSLRRTK